MDSPQTTQVLLRWGGLSCPREKLETFRLKILILIGDSLRADVCTRTTSVMELKL